MSLSTCDMPAVEGALSESPASSFSAEAEAEAEAEADIDASEPSCCTVAASDELTPLGAYLCVWENSGGEGG